MPSLTVRGAKTHTSECTMSQPSSGPVRPTQPLRSAINGTPAAGDALQRIAWLDAEAALAQMDTKLAGLFDDEVERRREKFGRNEVAHEKPHPWYIQLAHAFANPFNILLAT